MVRTYSERGFDPVAHELTVDFVVPGTVGVTGPWAAAAQPGDTLFVRGKGGGYPPDPTARCRISAGRHRAVPGCRRR